MSDFANGDVVKLKSGGPNMTIDHLIEGEKAVCSWFNDHIFNRNVFHFHSIIKATSNAENSGITNTIPAASMAPEHKLLQVISDENGEIGSKQ